jgi:glycosyltransferase involved in cell wall biosynthesis
VLEEDIRRLGLAGKALLTPYCQDMAAAMNAMDCLVHPLVGTEALPGVIIEAHACGKPVITTNLDGNPEALRVGGYGQLVSPGSVEQLAAAMRDWAGKPPLTWAERQQLHDRVAERFSLERALDDLEGFYAKLIEHPCRPELDR